MDALEAGADDIQVDEECIEITTATDDFHAVRDALEGKYTLSSAEISMVPQTMTELTDPEQIKMMSRMLEHMEDDDDVQDVYHNWDMPEDLE